MAYAPDPTQEEQQNQPGQTPVPTSSAPGAGPSGAKTPTGSVSNQQSAQPFQNLQTYLTANAPQIQQEANTISGGLNNQYGQVQNDLSTGVNNFTGQVNAGFAPEDPNLVSQAAANPAAFVQTPGNTAAFESQINDQYTGPANFEGTAGYAGLNKEVTTDAGNAALLNTPAGVQTYLQSTGTNPTAGENLLDTALIESNPQAIQEVQAAATPFSQLPTYLANDVTAADAVAAAAPGAAQQAATDANAAITGTANTFAGDLNNTLAADTSATQGYNTAVNNLIGQESNANPDLAALMNAISAYDTSAKGYSETNPYYGATSTLPNIDVGNLQTFNNPSTEALPTASSVATPADVAEQSALEQLIGPSYNPVITNPGQAGTYQTPGSVPTLQSYLAPALNTLGTDITGAQNDYTANGVLTPSGTPSGSIASATDIPTSDVFIPGQNAPGGIPYNPSGGGFGSVIPQSEVSSLPQYIPGTKIPYPTPVQGGGNISVAPPHSSTPYVASPADYTNNSGNLTALQQAYQALQAYLAGGG